MTMIVEGEDDGKDDDDDDDGSGGAGKIRLRKKLNTVRMKPKSTCYVHC